jgi:hypothetical protein
MTSLPAIPRKTSEAHVALTEIAGPFGAVRISTVQLPADMLRGGTWETFVFPGEGWSEVETDRYATQEEAEQGHRRMVHKYVRVCGVFATPLP